MFSRKRLVLQRKAAILALGWLHTKQQRPSLERRGSGYMHPTDHRGSKDDGVHGFGLTSVVRVSRYYLCTCKQQTRAVVLAASKRGEAAARAKGSVVWRNRLMFVRI